MGLELKIRLLKLGMTQRDLLKILRAKEDKDPKAFEGIVLDTSYISHAVNDEPAERFERLRVIIDQTLTEKEAQRAAENVVKEMQMRPFL